MISLTIKQNAYNMYDCPLEGAEKKVTLMYFES